MFEEATWKLDNRKLFATMDFISQATEIPITTMSQISAGGVCDPNEPARKELIAASAAYIALLSIFNVSLPSFVTSYPDMVEPSRKSKRAQSKAIKKIFKAYNPNGGARAATFLAMSAASTGWAMLQSDEPEFAEDAPYYEMLLDWLDEYLASVFFDEEDRTMLLAMNVTRNQNFAEWDKKCEEQGGTPADDPTCVAFHNDIGGMLAVSLVMASGVDVTRNTYACQGLDGLSQNAINQSYSPNWEAFRTFLAPVIWRDGLAEINELVMSNIKPFDQA